jgi:hypothetical protein
VLIASVALAMLPFWALTPSPGADIAVAVGAEQGLYRVGAVAEVEITECSRGPRADLCAGLHQIALALENP